MKDIEMTIKEYKELLIKLILEHQTNNKFTRKILEERTIRALEIIYDSECVII